MTVQKLEDMLKELESMVADAREYAKAGCSAYATKDTVQYIGTIVAQQMAGILLHAKAALNELSGPLEKMEKEKP